MAFTIYLQPNSTSGLTYSRSPVVYYFTGLQTTNKYTFDIYLSRGTTSSLTTSYATITRTPIVNNSITLDISSFINSFITDNMYYTENNATWCKVKYIETDMTGSTVASGYTNVIDATMGYTYYGEYAIGSTGDVNLTTTDLEYIMNSQQPNIDYIIPYAHYELALRYNSIYTHVIFWWRDSVDDERSSQYIIPTQRANANQEIKVITCGYKDLYEAYGTSVDWTKPMRVEFYSGPADTGRTLGETYNFIPDDCSDTITTLQFLNKWGVWDFLHFTGKKDTGLKITNETYKYNKLDAKLQYDLEFGQYHKSFTKGTGTVVLNSGWLDDVKNEKMEQLLLSEFVFDYTTRKPYIITDKEIKYKTARYDKLIQYSITLDEAYDKINSMI